MALVLLMIMFDLAAPLYDTSGNWKRNTFLAGWDATPDELSIAMIDDTYLFSTFAATT